MTVPSRSHLASAVSCLLSSDEDPCELLRNGFGMLDFRRLGESDREGLADRGVERPEDVVLAFSEEKTLDMEGWLLLMSSFSNSLVVEEEVVLAVSDSDCSTASLCSMTSSPSLEIGRR
jgi:hypothetical protein